MLYENFLSRIHNAVSVLTLSGILLGSTLITSSRAMNEEDHIPLNQRPVPGVIIDEVLPEEILVHHIINNPVLKERDRKVMALVSHYFSCLNYDRTLPPRSLKIVSTESLEWLCSQTQPLPQSPLVSHLWMYGHSNMNQTSYSFKKIFQILPFLTSLNIQGFSLKHGRVKDLTEAISQCTALTTLRMRIDEFGFESGINICGDSGVAVLAPAIATHPALKTLKLSCRMGDEGVKNIATILSQNLTLTELDLNSNKIGKEGAKVMAATLSQNHTLKTLDLSFNDIDEEGAEALLTRIDGDKPLIHLKHLNLKSNHFSIPPQLAKQVQEEYGEDGIVVIF